MKGNISLSDFITEVKHELCSSTKKKEDAFLELQEVELEVSFVVEAKGKTKAKFLVVDVEGEAKAEQVHKVRLKFDPIREYIEQVEKPTESFSAAGSPPSAREDKLGRPIGPYFQKEDKV